MKRKNKLVWLVLVLGIIVASCNKNYYSGNGKGSNCGCPSHKGMGGY